MHEDGSSLKGLHQVRPVKRKQFYFPLLINNATDPLPFYVIIRIKAYTESGSRTLWMWKMICSDPHSAINLYIKISDHTKARLKILSNYPCSAFKTVQLNDFLRSMSYKIWTSGSVYAALNIKWFFGLRNLMASFMRTVKAPATPRSSAVTGCPFLLLNSGMGVWARW